MLASGACTCIVAFIKLIHMMSLPYMQKLFI